MIKVNYEAYVTHAETTCSIFGESTAEVRLNMRGEDGTIDSISVSATNQMVYYLIEHRQQHFDVEVTIRPKGSNERGSLLQPLGNRVLIQTDEVKGASEGGIILPDRYAEDQTRSGLVVSVGWSNEETDNHFVSVGDRVLMPRFGGEEVDPGGDHIYKHRLLEEGDLIGILRPAPEK